jgi:hypothetical protein
MQSNPSELTALSQYKSFELEELIVQVGKSKGRFVLERVGHYENLSQDPFAETEKIGPLVFFSERTLSVPKSPHFGMLPKHPTRHQACALLLLGSLAKPQRSPTSASSLTPRTAVAE